MIGTALALSPHQFAIAKTAVETGWPITRAAESVRASGEFVPTGYDPATDTVLLAFIAKLHNVQRAASLLSVGTMKVLALEKLTEAESEGQDPMFAFWFKELKDLVIHEEKMSQATTRTKTKTKVTIA